MVAVSSRTSQRHELQRVAASSSSSSVVVSNAAWVEGIAVPLQAMRACSNHHHHQYHRSSSSSSSSSSCRAAIESLSPEQASAWNRLCGCGNHSHHDEAMATRLYRHSLSYNGSTVAISSLRFAVGVDPINAKAHDWYRAYAAKLPQGNHHHHLLRGVPIEAYEIVERVYTTLLTTKLAIALPLLALHTTLYRSFCLAVGFYVAYFMSSAMTHAVAHAVLEQGLLSWVSVATLSVGAGAGEPAVQWCIPLFADLSLLLVNTLYVNTHVLNRCKQVVQHGHHQSTVPIIKSMGKLTLKLLCIMAISLVAAKQPVMNQLLVYYMTIMLASFLSVYCGILPFLDCLPPAALSWPYRPDDNDASSSVNGGQAAGVGYSY